MTPLNVRAAPPRISMASHFRKTERALFHALWHGVFDPLSISLEAPNNAIRDTVA
jgi:hypothetical protein